MKKKVVLIIFVALVLAFHLWLALSAGRRQDSIEATAEPVSTPAPLSTAEPVEPSAAPVKSGRQNGERFEAVIMIEGMEETVQYEHIVNETAGFEMDYDYEHFTRRSEADRESFLSIWDDAAKPENYLEVTFSPEDAETAAASVRNKLSQEFDLTEVTRELENAGSCIRIEASVIKGTNRMADYLQAVYIIPASDGCRIATAHYFIAESEGFSRRFNYMLHTLTVMERNGGNVLTDEQAISAVRSYCFKSNAELENIISAEEYPAYWEITHSDEQQIVVLYRSYTGAQVRYYIDRTSGDTYSTEFVPGITPEEELTDESFNARDYL